MINNSIIMQLVIIVILTMINAFFAASEIAIIAINKKNIEKKYKEGNKKAGLLLSVLKKPSRFLSTIQVGITLAGFFSAGSAAVGISDKLGVYLGEIGLPYAKNISFIVVTILLSYFVLVFGELVPKRIALHSKEKVAMFSIKPITIVAKIMKPFVTFLSFSTNAIVKILGYDTDRAEEGVTLEEIKYIIETGEEQGIIETIEKDMINSIMTFDNKYAEEVMTARTDVYMINIEKPLDEYINQIMTGVYSRIPVYEKTVDKIIGILYLKDFMTEIYKKEIKNINLREIIRPAYFVPERIKIDDLFINLQKNKNHIAILIDEYGGFSGIVTMEDLLEEIVGDIEDEHDKSGEDIRRINKDKYYASGTLSIKEMNRILNTDIDETSNNYDTLGGFLIYLLGRIPEDGEKKEIEFKNLILKIEEVKDKKINKVSIIIK